MHIQLATLAVSPYWTQESILLAKTLRKFGGALADAPLTVFHPQDQPPDKGTARQLAELAAETAPFELDPHARNFPLAVVPFGAAAAEAHASNVDLLIWLLPDTLILNPPVVFLITESKQLAYRPVHHQNVGSVWDQPLDPFWQKIYAHCEVPEVNVFEMVTCYQESVRPYFNAGLLVTRPQNGLCRDWLETFLNLHQHPDFVPFFEQQKYAVFLHQAVLAGVILNRYPQAALAELPESYNYPLHMHADYPAGHKPARLAELVTARYERAADLPDLLLPFKDAAQVAGLL